MKKLLTVAALTAFTTLFCFADPAEGSWLSRDEKTNKITASWTISVSDGILGGVITSIPEKDPSTKAEAGKGKSYANFYNGEDVGSRVIVGTQWIQGLKKKNEGEWKDGFIIDPESGKQYKCSITFHKADGKKYKQDTLEMRGSIGPVGRSQYWIKADQAE